MFFRLYVGNFIIHPEEGFQSKLKRWKHFEDYLRHFPLKFLIKY